MFKQILFAPDYLQEMKKYNKDFFWSNEFIRFLIQQADLTEYCQDCSSLTVLNILGPVRDGYYEIVVESHSDNHNYSKKMALAVNVKFSVTTAIKQMKEKLTDEVLKSGYILHKVHEEIFDNNEINILPHLTRSATEEPSYYSYDLPPCERDIWLSIAKVVIEEIVDKILMDRINGPFAIAFPGDTSGLELLDIQLITSTSHYFSYKLEVLPYKTTVMNDEIHVHNFVNDRKNIVINIPKKYINNLKEKIFKSDMVAYTIYSILPAIKISNIYDANFIKPKQTFSSGIKKSFSEQLFNSMVTFLQQNSKQKTKQVSAKDEVNDLNGEVYKII